MELQRILRVLIVVLIVAIIMQFVAGDRIEQLIFSSDRESATPVVAVTSVALDDDTVDETPTAIIVQTPTVQVEIPAITDTEAVFSFLNSDAEIIWQDSFDNQSSGWEPRYEVAVADYGYKKEDMEPISNSQWLYAITDPRLIAWNGYENGGYHFYLPGIPELKGETASVLWDFNPTVQLPAYPYRVRADISVDPVGNSMLLLDYIGNYGAIEQGDGIAVIWGQNDGRSYKYADVWGLVVLEFHNGSTWALGCTNKTASNVAGNVSSMVVDVDTNALAVSLYDANGGVQYVTCKRAAPGPNDEVRRLGIGAVYPRPAVPANDYNKVTFNDVYVMAGQPVVGDSDAQKVTGRCTANWVGYDDEVREIDIVTVISSETDCRNVYKNFSSDFPGYGPERLPMPDTSTIVGNWKCGVDTPTSQFRLEQRGDMLMMTIEDQSLYVYYAKEIMRYWRSAYDMGDGVAEGYVVTNTTRGGNNQTYESVDFVQIGDGIGYLDQHHYYFVVEGDQILTNWTALPCTRG